MGKLISFQRLETPGYTEPEWHAGEVAIVGAGPGDPGLLTLRAFQLMQQAEVVVFDRLVSTEIMAMVTPKAERIDAGKSSKKHVLTQDRTNELLVEQARLGKKVLRLKGGDPYIFGRGGEEVEYLIEAGVPFRVVPGITSAQGCSTYAGFPLTHRDYAQSVTFVTGHRKSEGGISGVGDLALDWKSLAASAHTVVFYMGLGNAEAISSEMIRAGRASSTPVALIERGTRPGQRTLITDLLSMPDAIIHHGFQPPTMIVVGEVVSMARQNNAWDSHPMTCPRDEQTRLRL
jgi:uroporphyrin-III C-methyltransferase/precorrin-2 dehydrogenase/sirohydrochlorin ferrochelatase